MNHLVQENEAPGGRKVINLVKEMNHLDKAYLRFKGLEYIKFLHFR